MKSFMLLLCIGFSVAAQDRAPKHELSFALGGITPLSRTAQAGQVDLGAGIALQSNYARRFMDRRSFALYGELQFVASPLREVNSTFSSATRDVASLYVMPGLRLKFAPVHRVSPFVAAGVGPAWYEQSKLQLNGSPNAAPRETVRAAFDFGGGADIAVWKWIALRGEIRDFYSGSPAYNIASIKGGQHNVIAGAGFVLRWGQ